MIDSDQEFFLDPSRCIGCQACVHACAECETHRGMSMIHLEYVDRAESTQTVPVVCMHCDEPACAKVCPADAIKKWRTLMGATDPAKADAGTLRKDFGASIEHNATHGSDAPETAAPRASSTRRSRTVTSPVRVAAGTSTSRTRAA